MIFYELQIFLIALFFISILGYILVVIKEKVYLKDNIIIIEKKSLTQDSIDEAEIKVFMLGDKKISAGDQIRLTISNKKRVSGTVLGAKIEQNELVLITNRDKIKKLKVDTIRKVKITSRYGRFFNAF